MKTLVSKGLFRVARASRLISHLIGALTVLGIIVSPFVASSVPNAIVRVILWLAAASGTWLILYVGLPSLLARLAVLGWARASLTYDRARSSSRADTSTTFQGVSARTRGRHHTDRLGYVPPVSGGNLGSKLCRASSLETRKPRLSLIVRKMGLSRFG
jgi:hypothetical protein